jgi:Zn finger protein HypA/HybF involved in hydrogenase expression
MFKSKNYTRLISREKHFQVSKPSECKCDYCEENLLQVGYGYEEGKTEVPLYRCSTCEYVEVIVNDNSNAVIKKVEKMY